MKDTIKEIWAECKWFIIFIYVVFFIGSFIVGIGNNSNCTYDSIASRINIPYIIGCELARPRFKVAK